MRRALIVLTVLALMVLTGAALAESTEENYLDKFSSVSYRGNDGSLDWSSPWKEVGEGDGPSSGKVRVEDNGHCAGNRCLVIGDEGLLTAGHGAWRLADLSMFEKAELEYKVGFYPGTLLATADLVVEVSIDGGLTWVIVKTVPLATEQEAKGHSLDISLFMSSKFGVRFTATGALGAEVSVDEVEIEGSVPPPATTTTTSTSTTSTTTSSTTTTSTTTTTLLDLSPPTLPGLETTTTTTTTATTTTTTDLESNGPTTTSDVGDTTTTAAAGGGGGDDDSGDDGGGDEASPETGLRRPSVGVGSDVPRDLFGPMPEVLAFEVAASYTNAVELIEASWVWVLGLALMIAAALIKGVDRRFGGEPASDSEA